MVLDKNFRDGIDKQTFVRYVRHVIIKRFHWPEYIADIVLKMYSDTNDVDDPIANRNQYVTVSTSYV